MLRFTEPDRAGWHKDFPKIWKEGPIEAMSNSTRKKKKIFHPPEKKGKLRDIPPTPANRVLSVLSLAVQAAMMVFAVYAVMTGAQGRESGHGPGGEYRLIYLIFPLVSWVIALGFRLACRYLPLEMWRLPVRVKAGMIRTEGTLLKLSALLLELETAVCFFYIDVSLYLGYEPSDALMLVWVAALALSVYLPCRQAGRIGAGMVRL